MGSTLPPGLPQHPNQYCSESRILVGVDEELHRGWRKSRPMKVADLCSPTRLVAGEHMSKDLTGRGRDCRDGGPYAALGLEEIGDGGSLDRRLSLWARRGRVPLGGASY
jgi:hypothetical protein